MTQNSSDLRIVDAIMRVIVKCLPPDEQERLQVRLTVFSSPDDTERIVAKGLLSRLQAGVTPDDILDWYALGRAERGLTLAAAITQYPGYTALLTQYEKFLRLSDRIR